MAWINKRLNFVFVRISLLVSRNNTEIILLLMHDGSKDEERTIVIDGSLNL